MAYPGHPYHVPMFPIPAVTWASAPGSNSVGKFPNPKSVMRICKSLEFSLHLCALEPGPESSHVLLTCYLCCRHNWCLFAQMFKQSLGYGLAGCRSCVSLKVVCGSHCLYPNLHPLSKEKMNFTILIECLRLEVFFFIFFGLEMDKAQPCVHLGCCCNCSKVQATQQLDSLCNPSYSWLLFLFLINIPQI